METRKAIHERRSVRRFLERKVEEKKIMELIDAAQWAPSSCNKQMWEFVVVRDKKVKEDLADKAKATAFIKNSPVAIYVLYRKDVNSEFQANIQSASAAIQNILLAAHDMGLGAVWVADCGNRDKVRKILNVPDSFAVVAAVYLGYPAVKPSAPKRGPIEDVVHFDSFSGKEKQGKIFPEEWNEKSLSDYRSRGIRATSPTPEAFIPGFRKEFMKSMKRVSSLIPEGKVLDVLSFGGAHLMEIMKNSKASFHAYDVSDEILNFIKKRKEASGISKGLALKKGSIYKIPYTDGEFDCVTCINKLETIPEPERLVAEMARVLKADGTLILSFWNSRSMYGLNYKVKTGPRGKNDVTSNEGPVKPISYRKVKSLLGKNFKVEKRYGLNLAPSMEGFLAPKGLKSFCRVNILVCKKVKG